MEGRSLFFPPYVLMHQLLAYQKQADNSISVQGWENAELAGKEMGGIVEWMF